MGGTQRNNEAEAARAYFPRGLVQPAGSFRFSADALLLACFPKLGSKVERFLDLGAGCGVVGLALLCRCPRLAVLGEGIGIECDPTLVAAARENAAHLGLSGRLRVLQGDIAHDALPVAPGSCDLVLANPPYREKGRGRLPQSPSRQRALFAEAGLLEAFCRAAALSLKESGRFVLVFPAGRLEDACLALAGAGLALSRVLPVRTKSVLPARLLLMEAVKKDAVADRPHAADPPQGAAPARTQGAAAVKGGRGRPAAALMEAARLVTEPDLVLHPGEGGGARFTPEAVSFCPFLSPSR